MYSVLLGYYFEPVQCTDAVIMLTDSFANVCYVRYKPRVHVTQRCCDFYINVCLRWHSIFNFQDLLNYKWPTDSKTICFASSWHFLFFLDRFRLIIWCSRVQREMKSLPTLLSRHNSLHAQQIVGKDTKAYTPTVAYHRSMIIKKNYDIFWRWNVQLRHRDGLPNSVAVLSRQVVPNMYMYLYVENLLWFSSLKWSV